MTQKEKTEETLEYEAQKKLEDEENKEKKI